MGLGDDKEGVMRLHDMKGGSNVNSLINGTVVV